MIKKLLALSLFAAISVNAFGAEFLSTWTGNGQWDDWTDAANWNTANYPNNDDTTSYNVLVNQEAEISGNSFVQVEDITFENAEIDVDFNHNTLIFSSMTMNGESSVDLYQCDLVGMITNNAEFDYSESELTGGITNNGAFWFCGGEVDGAIINNENAIMGIDGGTELSGDLVNSGLILVMPGDSLEMEDGELTNTGTIKLKGGTLSLFDMTNYITNDGDIMGCGGIFSDQPIVNNGEIKSIGSMLTIHTEAGFTNGSSNPYVDGSKRIKADSGSTLVIEMGLNEMTNYGQIVVEPSGTLVVRQESIFATEGSGAGITNNKVIYMMGGTISAETVTFKDDSFFQGFGSFNGDIRVEAGARVLITGPTTILGEIEILPGATVEIRDGKTFVVEDIVNNGTIRLVGGNIVSPGGIAGQGEVIYVDSASSSTFDSNKDGAVNMLDLQAFATSWLWSANWNTSAQ